MSKRPYPNIYEINTRVWIRRFDRTDHRAGLRDIPDAFWDFLQAQGIDYVWMMGIWKTVAREAILRYAIIPGLEEEYGNALSDWSEADVIGSPYAIDQYQPSDRLGDWDDLGFLRNQLHQRGMKLILDFIPNHFHAESGLIDRHPYLFLTADDAQLQHDPATFYQYHGKVWAHGRDPYFPAWQDTIQVNYFDDRARQFMMDQLLQLTQVCDGVRCDMAMLMINTVFESTWRYTSGFEDKNIEFWEQAIAKVKKKAPAFQFIAEAYWDLEWQLQQMGFDYTYDKRLLDRIHELNVPSIRGHLFADPDFRDRSVRFLENHDEHRILSRANTRQAEAAAIITYTLPGMRFFHQGQWEGRRIRLPVQLGREPIEHPCTCVMGDKITIWPGFVRPVCKCTFSFYGKLVKYLKKPIFRQGSWQQITILEGTEHLLAWRWEWDQQNVLIIVNYSNHSLKGQLSDWTEKDGDIAVLEPWRNLRYTLNGSEILQTALYPFEYRLLEF